MRPKQVGLNAEQPAVAAGIMEERFDARLLLDQHRQRERTYARTGPEAIRNGDHVDPADAQLPRPRDCLVGTVAAGRHELDGDNEGAFRQRMREP